MNTDSTAGEGPVDRVTHVGRRTVLGLAGLAVAGTLGGAWLDDHLQSTLSPLSRHLGALGALVPGAGNFRYYTVTGNYPDIDPASYRLHVGGMVEHPLELSLEDLRTRLPRTDLEHYFQCVTGWRVEDVRWQGVRLSAILDRAVPTAGASALRFFSGDGVYTESLTLHQARLRDVLVADRMIGDDVTRAHGGPVRLYVAPMYGYKSIKWLDRIEVTNRIVPGYWEDAGYPVNAWIQ